MSYVLNETKNQCFDLMGKMGRTLRALEVGVIGTGAIGRSVIKRLKGFGCSIRVVKRASNADLENEVERVDMATLLAKSDVVTLHLSGETEGYLMDENPISQMKEGAGIVNTARGHLIQLRALVKALQDGKLAFAALDVIEGENVLFYRDLSGKALKNDPFLMLSAMPNVILSPHIAFYT